MAWVVYLANYIFETVLVSVTFQKSRISGNISHTDDRAVQVEYLIQLKILALKAISKKKS